MEWTREASRSVIVERQEVYVKNRSLLVALIVSVSMLSSGAAMLTAEPVKPDSNRLLLISIIDANKTFYARLDRDTFEDHLRNVGPDLTITVLSPRVVSRVANRMEQETARCVDSPTQPPDLRYRLELKTEGGETLAVYYVSMHGDLYDRTGRCGVRADGAFLAELWREIEAKSKLLRSADAK